MTEMTSKVLTTMVQAQDQLHAPDLAPSLVQDLVQDPAQHLGLDQDHVLGHVTQEIDQGHEVGAVHVVDAAHLPAAGQGPVHTLGKGESPGLTLAAPITTDTKDQGVFHLSLQGSVMLEAGITQKPVTVLEFLD